MKLIFAGTPDFAAAALEALIAAGHDIVLVLTQPDRPAGRGMKLTPSPVKVVAQKHQLPVYQPEKLRTPEQQAPVAAIEADAMIVAAYGIILPQAVLDMPRLGCLNIHASLLPRWRGAAPIQRAILAGDADTGITIMQMDAGLDTGDMLSVHVTPITADDAAHTLHDKLMAQGAAAIVSALADLPALQAARKPQPADGVTYAEKLRKEESQIDWQRPAAELDRMIRAFNPFPSAQTTLDGNPLKIWRATPCAGSGMPGTVLQADRDGIVVACGDGALKLLELQKAGGKRMDAAALLAGSALPAGSVLGV
ncbi:methionyl-tRNA formyltransferase [Andreprevotia lacus DSM 23236]|jgi:methionyl-tRNA formyltransferase|uniref:Methionyl-tRNA formyltransferase n=1 Tax=Andreprevotia lacus DSM 23236 TaxID=1121001 RepID=A0A1W1XXZ5_9NEIS|nr:methionyl-tRNA formyltransferase [Andreprevotia lacus]SMC28727.1 methionyl-tRNA formyltransferase [Andreprevotia lacus DSM 23236]